eukprot:6181569-Pleurochrysis_carterae.AAC.4
MKSFVPNFCGRRKERAASCRTERARQGKKAKPRTRLSHATVRDRGARAPLKVFHAACHGATTVSSNEAHSAGGMRTDRFSGCSGSTPSKPKLHSHAANAHETSTRMRRHPRRDRTRSSGREPESGASQHFHKSACRLKAKRHKQYRGKAEICLP